MIDRTRGSPWGGNPGVHRYFSIPASPIHRPGLLKHVTEPLMREALDIRYLYGSALGEQKKCLIVFSCQDDDRAVVVLDKELAAQKTVA